MRAPPLSVSSCQVPPAAHHFLYPPQSEAAGPPLARQESPAAPLYSKKKSTVRPFPKIILTIRYRWVPGANYRMTSHPTSAQNSGLSNNSISNSSFPPPPGHVVSSSSTSTSSTAAASYAYSQQPPASEHHNNHLHHQPSTTSSTTRFNSFSLPPYRNTHPATDSPNPTATHPAFAHNPFAAPNPNLADSDSRLQPGSTSSTYQQQQQAPSQLLSSSNITSSSSTPSGSAAKTAGGGGGSGSAGSGVQNLSLGQIHLLIATINDRNYETKRKEIQRVC